MKKEFDLNEDGDFEEAPVFTLFDEEKGTDAEYVLLARTVIREQLYYALAAISDPESYVILAVKEDGEDIVFEAIADDELFDEIAAAFDDLFDEEFDYDK